MRNEFLKACAHGRLDKIEEYLQCGVDVNTAAEDYEWILEGGFEPGYTGLSIAAGRGQIACMDKLIECCADINHVNQLPRGTTTALLVAIRRRQLDSVDYLIRHGADLKTTDMKGRNALHLACMMDVSSNFSNESKPFIEMLVESGIDINAQDHNGWTPIMNSAIHQQNIENLEFLFVNGADVLLKNGVNSTLLTVVQDNYIFGLDDKIKEMEVMQESMNQHRYLSKSIGDANNDQARLAF